MNRIKKIELDNFKGFRGQHSINVDADLILLAGANGSGKTSLLHAITLYLNGYDKAIFNGQELCNKYAGTKICKVFLEGISDTKDVKAFTDKEWQNRTSVFQVSRQNINPAVARVATSFFQDSVAELANGDFLEYLTGAGNQGKQILNWAKDASRRWKGKAEFRLPNEKNWDDERKRIFQVVFDRISALPDGSSLKAYFSEFSPLISSGNLSKYWQSQVVNLSGKLGVSVQLKSYTSVLLEEMITALRNIRIDLEKENQRKQEAERENQKWGLRLKNLLAHSPEVGLWKQAQWESVSRELQKKKRELEGLQKIYDKLKECELKTSTVEELLGILDNNLPEIEEEVRRLKNVHIPLPQQVSELVEAIVAFFKRDEKTPAEYFVDWLNRIYDELARQSEKIKNTNRQIREMEDGLTISKYLTEKKEGLALLNENAGLCTTEAILNELKISIDQQPNSYENQTDNELRILQQVEDAFKQLSKLEYEHEEFQQKKQKMNSYKKAKKFAEIFLTALDKETKKTGVFQKTLDDLNLSAVEQGLQIMLTAFHLPIEFVENVRLSRKGTGRNAAIVPTMNELGFDNLSTGQKTIFALAWTVVLNSTLRSRLGHRVMLFDDITTSLDLNQIIPACVLFRKLAYSKTESNRRQLFVSSHHEDLTNRLLDYLIPPAAYSMKIIEFKDYSVETGPSYDVWEVEPAKQM